MAREGFIDPAALERSLAGLRRSTGDSELMDALNEVIAATKGLFAASGAGFMMVDDSTVLCSVAATDEPGRLLEERQIRSGQGPCVDALAHDRVTHSADLAADHRWPRSVRDVSSEGVRAVVGMPIRVGGVAVGALNVYRDHPGTWDASEIEALEAYGRVIEGLLLAALQARERERLATQLQHALEHRVVIERAVGAVMARAGVDAVTAFNQLRDRARQSQRKVADVAQDLLGEVVSGS